MATLIGIRYVGKKTHPQKDTVAGTGLVWEDGTQVHMVPDPVAAKLLKHPDVWGKEGSQQVADSLADLGIATEPELMKQPEPELPPLVPLDTMDRQALIVYAKSHFGQTLQPNMKEENMRAKIQAWMNSPMANGQ